MCSPNEQNPDQCYYSPMPMSRNSTELTIPHEHYVVFYPDVDKGGFQCHLSPIFKTGDASLPKKDLMVRLHQAFNQATQHQYDTPTMVSNVPDNFDNELATSFSSNTPPESPARISAHSPFRTRERQRDFHDGQFESGENEGRIDMQSQSLEILNQVSMRARYNAAFRAFQQKNNRHLAKAWVAKLEPKKQTNHPYNGKMKKEMADDPDARPDPEKTKPYWWPKDIEHREPDHLGKDQRVRLLMHILCDLDGYEARYETLKAMDPPDNGPEFHRYRRELDSLGHILTIKPTDLLESAKLMKLKFEPKGSWAILKEIIYDREGELYFRNSSREYPPSTRIEAMSIEELNALGTCRDVTKKERTSPSPRIGHFASNRRMGHTRPSADLSSSELEDAPFSPECPSVSGDQKRSRINTIHQFTIEGTATQVSFQNHSMEQQEERPKALGSSHTPIYSPHQIPAHPSRTAISSGAETRDPSQAPVEYPNLTLMAHNDFHGPSQTSPPSSAHWPFYQGSFGLSRPQTIVSDRRDFQPFESHRSASLPTGIFNTVDYMNSSTPAQQPAPVPPPPTYPPLFHHHHHHPPTSVTPYACQIPQVAIINPHLAHSALLDTDMSDSAADYSELYRNRPRFHETNMHPVHPPLRVGEPVRSRVEPADYDMRLTSEW